MRRLLKIIGFLLLLPFVVLAVAIAALQFQPVRDRLAVLIEETASGPDFGLELEGFRGSPPFDLRLERLALSDSEGQWLELEDFRLAVAWPELFKLRGEIEEISARTLTVSRAPVSTAPVEEPPDETTLPPPPNLPDSLPPVAIDRLAVGEIRLGAPLLGEAVTLNLDGHARVSDAKDDLDIALALKRLDADTAQASLQVALDLVTEILALDLHAEETGGLLAKVSGKPEAGDLKLDFAGKGPLADWQGRLDLEAQNLATLSSQIRLAYTDRLALGLNAEFNPNSALLPPGIEPLTGTALTLSLDAEYGDPGIVTLKDLALVTDGPTLTAAGEVNLDQQTHDLRASLELAALAKASTLASAELGGAVSLALTSHGPLRQPAVEAKLDGSDIAFDQLTLERLALTLDAAARAPLDGGSMAAEATLNGEIRNLAQAGKPLLIEDRLTLDATASLKDQSQIDLSALRIATGNVTLDSHAKFDTATMGGVAQLNLAVPQLGQVLTTYAGSPPPLDLRGSLNFALPVEIEPDLAKIVARPELKLNGIEGLPPGAAELLGASPSLGLVATLIEQKRLDLEDLSLDGAGLFLAGNGAADLETKTLKASLQADIPSMSVLSKAAGTDLAGSLRLNADADGTFKAPNANLDLAVANFSGAGQEVDQIDLRLTQSGTVEAPMGTIGLKASFETDVVALDADYSLADEVFTIEDLVVTAPATRLAGAAAFDLETQLAEAELEGGITDLGALQRWHKQQLAGTLTFDATVTPNNGDQNAVVDLQLANVAGDFGKLDQAILQGTVGTIKSEPDLTLDLSLREFSAPGAVLRQGGVAVKGPLSQMLVDVTARGAVQDLELSLDTSAAVGVKPGGQEIRITSLDGAVGAQELKLAKPTTIRIQGQDLSVTDLDLGFGEARLVADVALDANEARSDIRLSDLDLAILEEFGAPSLHGNAGLTVTSRGRPNAPTVDVSANVDGLAPGTGSIDMSADLSTTLSYESGRLQAALEGNGLSEKPLTAEVSLPVDLALRPFAFTLQDNAPLSGSVDFETQLERLAAIADLEAQVLRGPLKIALTIGGVMSAPLVNGEATIRNAYIADSLSGAELRNLNLVLNAQDNRIDIAELNAVDGGKGTIKGDGFVDLREAAPEAFDVKLDFAGFRALDSELGTALLSGSVGAGGAFDDLGVTGNLTIDRADLSIAGSAGGSSVNTLDVQEVSAQGEEPAEQQPASAPVKVALDITVNMPSQIFIRGRGLDTEWGGNLKITGDSSAPVIVGSIDYRRGFLDLMGERFQITQGTITFDGGNPPNPEITLVAEADAGTIKAIVKITGRATSPDIELTSEPPLPQDEVISQLFFGKDSSSLTPAQGVRLAMAIDTLRGGSDALGKLRSLVGLDTLSVSGESQEDAALTAGQYINDRVYLEVQRGATDGSGKARVEIELNDRFSVETNVTEEAQTGVGLNWSYDY